MYILKEDASGVQVGNIEQVTIQRLFGQNNFTSKLMNFTFL